MSDANYARFNERLHEIESRHRGTSSGFVRLVERNGILAPAEQSRGRRGLPVRGIVLSLLAFLVFKGILLAQLGAVTYVSRVAQLEAGTIVEQMGAWAMRADPLTLWIADMVGKVF
ncbi:MAG: hypothetical protein R3D59_13445 [Paracoccaceae bacterium]|nr:hypothetical protein [Maritimibacter sp.]